MKIYPICLQVNSPIDSNFFLYYAYFITNGVLGGSISINYNCSTLIGTYNYLKPYWIFHILIIDDMYFTSFSLLASFNWSVPIPNPQRKASIRFKLLNILPAHLFAAKQLFSLSPCFHSHSKKTANYKGKITTVIEFTHTLKQNGYKLCIHRVLREALLSWWIF